MLQRHPAVSERRQKSRKTRDTGGGVCDSLAAATAYHGDVQKVRRKGKEIVCLLLPAYRMRSRRRPLQPLDLPLHALIDSPLYHTLPVPSPCLSLCPISGIHMTCPVARKKGPTHTACLACVSPQPCMCASALSAYSPVMRLTDLQQAAADPRDWRADDLLCLAHPLQALIRPSTQCSEPCSPRSPLCALYAKTRPVAKSLIPNACYHAPAPQPYIRRHSKEDGGQGLVWHPDIWSGYSVPWPHCSHLTYQGACVSSAQLSFALRTA